MICGWIMFYSVLLLAVTATLCMVVNLLASVRRVVKNGRGVTYTLGKGGKLEANTSLANCMKGYKWILAAVWGILFFGYLTFCLKYPFSCTMDARYIVPNIFVCLIFTMMANERLSQARPKLGRAMLIALGVLGLIFAAATVIFYVGIH